MDRIPSFQGLVVDDRKLWGLKLMALLVSVWGMPFLVGQTAPIEGEGGRDLLEALENMLRSQVDDYPSGRAKVVITHRSDVADRNKDYPILRGKVELHWKGANIRAEGVRETAFSYPGTTRLEKLSFVQIHRPNLAIRWSKSQKVVRVDAKGLPNVWDEATPQHLWFGQRSGDSLARLIAPIWGDDRTIRLDHQQDRLVVSHVIRGVPTLFLTFDASRSPPRVIEFEARGSIQRMDARGNLIGGGIAKKETYEWTDAPSHLPVPRRIEIQRGHRPGGPLVPYATWEFEEVDLEADVPDSLFTLESLPLPEGTTITDLRFYESRRDIRTYAVGAEKPRLTDDGIEGATERVH